MHPEPLYADVQYCPFVGVQREIVYECYRTEYCCPEGCCIKSVFTAFKSWYIWIPVICILFACSGGLRCCKMLYERRQRLREQHRRFSRSTTPEVAVPITYASPNVEIYLNNSSPRPTLSNLDDRMRNILGTTEACNAAIERYIASRNARNRERNSNSSPPPYHTIFYKSHPVEASEPPPHYSTVCNIPALQIPQTEGQSEAVFADLPPTRSRENSSVVNEHITVTISSEVVNRTIGTTVVIPERNAYVGDAHTEPPEGAGRHGNLESAGGNNLKNI